ncbi:HNH endonuclease [Ralstonia pseudosolanacearum]|uniref:Conserved hypothethical protein n=1 Tax=Ralstonia solanacearum TaxID=305 RepID=A0A0S4TU22_RALSL|nr:calcium-binding protein [Ralstonia solanacearum]CUV13568.1 Conserved hypothethical protein [Ralstonia solanacearum]
MRPVSKPANSPHYNPPATLAFAGNNAAILQKIAVVAPPYAYNYTVSLSDALLALLKIAQGQSLPNITATEQKTIVKAIADRVADIYKTASAPLTQDLGDYCSYCGTPLPGLLEVEHTVPKSPYPTFTTDWTNFLLCCGPCNTAKSNTPSRATATPWTNKFSPTEQELYDAIRDDHYIWPDLNSTSWDDLPLYLEYVNPVNGQWAVLSAPFDTDLNNKLTGYDVVNHKVYADIKVSNTNTLNNVQVAVTVASANTHGLQARADAMIDLMQFNNDVTNQLTGTYDRRVMNRTRAWFYALEKCKLLETATTRAEFDLLWSQVPMMGATSGFYSVWVTVLGNFDDPSGTNYASRFVADTNHPMLYPNTDTTNLP